MSEQKLTAKQERFAQLIAAGSCSQADAYRTAYQAADLAPARVHERASRLMANRKVVARVGELRAPAVAQAGITFAGHLERLGHLSAKAETAGQHGAAIAAEVWRGKAIGYYAERVRTEDLDKLTEDELEMVSRGKVPARLKIVS